MSGLAAVVASDDDLLPERGVVLRSRQLEPRVRVGAGRTLRAEPGQVVEAEHPADVSVAAGGAVAAEPAVVPGAVADLALGVDMEERALLVVAGV